jgi:flagella basal body P-ring formation protein FlgA
MNDPDSSNGTFGCIAKSEGGQATMDYLVVCAALAFALFYPIKDDPASPDKARTAAQIILDSFKLAYQNISHAISLPG